MNLELLESFGQNFPEDFDGTLDCISLAVTCQFNRRGMLLAVGCNDGRVVIWDFLTRGIAKIITAHAHPVCSISWSRNGHKLLSASTDNNVCVWDVLSGDCEARYRFPAPVLKVQFNPRDSGQFLVCPMKHTPVLVQSDGTYNVLSLEDDSDLNIVASFDRRGYHIYSGNARGRVLVVRSTDLKVIASFKVTLGTGSSTAIKSIEFQRRGECFLVNTADRIIRVYDCGEVLACGLDGEPEPIQKLQDLVNRTPWKKCVFSGDGEFIVAGSARQHALYIWERCTGSLVKILHGTRGELLLDVVWHPVRPIISSISSGVVSVWAQNQVENWSAFAPDFKELDENVEYEERESEFDIEDEDKEVEPTQGSDEEDVDVDVTAVDRVPAFCSSDEEEEDGSALSFLPVAPDIEDPEELPWTHDMSAVTEVTTNEPNKRPSPADKSSNSTKKKKLKTHDIQLHDAPSDEVHPLLGPSRVSNPTNTHPADTKSKKKNQTGSQARSKSHHKTKSSPYHRF